MRLDKLAGLIPGRPLPLLRAGGVAAGLVLPPIGVPGGPLSFLLSIDEFSLRAPAAVLLPRRPGARLLSVYELAAELLLAVGVPPSMKADRLVAVVAAFVLRATLAVPSDPGAVAQLLAVEAGNVHAHRPLPPIERHADHFLRTPQRALELFFASG